jgi:hypothetical protein
MGIYHWIKRFLEAAAQVSSHPVHAEPASFVLPPE